MTAQQEFNAFRAEVEKEPRALGLILSGSQAREGTATLHSDYDLIMVVADDATEALRAGARRDARLDVSVMPLAEFRTHATAGSDTEWNRYAFTHAKVLKDTAEGHIAELASNKGRLTESEAAKTAPLVLDAFLNSVYRCLKNRRDGNTVGTSLDAAEALPYYLDYVFALHQRIRPYNKYLGWELKNHPLSQSTWAHDHLLGLLAKALSQTAAQAVRQMLNELEPHARAAAHAPVLDAWGDDLTFMRGGGDTRSDT